MMNPNIPNEVKRKVSDVVMQLPASARDQAMDVFAEFGAKMYSLGCADSLEFCIKAVDRMRLECSDSTRV